MLALIGGFIGVVTRLTGYAIGGYQTFVIDKSMIKKLYSKKDKKTLRGRTRTQSVINLDKKQDKVKDAIQNRSIFSYNYRSALKTDIKRQLYWLCCCCCCRRPLRITKDEFYYKNGLKKLYTEIDLLEVVKQIRILKFMAMLELNQGQRELVKFVKPYLLNRQKITRERSDSGETAVAVSHPLQTLYNFKPESNQIDKKLYDMIVDSDAEKDEEEFMSLLENDVHRQTRTAAHQQVRT